MSGKKLSKLELCFLSSRLGWLGKILSYRFQYTCGAKDDNSEFSFPSMVPYTKVKFEVIVFGYRIKIDNSELKIITSKQFHVS